VVDQELGGEVTHTDERERDTWTRRSPMTKQEKLEQIRQMRAELQTETKKESNSE
jgi:hypothetical protein